MAKKTVTKTIEGIVYSVHATRATKTLKPLEDVLCPLHDDLASYVGYKGFSLLEIIKCLRQGLVIRLQAQMRALASGGKMPASYLISKVAELMGEDAERYTAEGVFNNTLMQADVQACWEDEHDTSIETEDVEE